MKQSKSLEQSFRTASEAFLHYRHEIKEHGEKFSETKALFNQSFTILEPMNNFITSISRRWNPTYANREWEWYLSGSRSVETIKHFAKIWDTMHSGDNLVWSNYGYWWNRNSQLYKVIQMLKEDPNTRRAIIVHYSVDEMDEYEKDTPCNVALNFYILDRKLHMTVFARSIDLWFGFCNDQYVFSKLLETVSLELELPIGTIHYFITNLHLYKQHL